MNAEARKQKRARGAQKMKVLLQSKTPEKRHERLQRQSIMLQLETPEERQERLQDLSHRQSTRLQLEIQPHPNNLIGQSISTSTGAKFDWRTFPRLQDT